MDYTSHSEMCAFGSELPLDSNQGRTQWANKAVVSYAGRWEDVKRPSAKSECLSSVFIFVSESKTKTVTQKKNIKIFLWKEAVRGKCGHHLRDTSVNDHCCGTEAANHPHYGPFLLTIITQRYAKRIVLETINWCLKAPLRDFFQWFRLKHELWTEITVQKLSGCSQTNNSQLLKHELSLIRIKWSLKRLTLPFLLCPLPYCTVSSFCPKGSGQAHPAVNSWSYNIHGDRWLSALTMIQYISYRFRYCFLCSSILEYTRELLDQVSVLVKPENQGFFVGGSRTSFLHGVSGQISKNIFRQ